MTGKKYGRITFIKRAASVSGDGGVWWWVHCDCGTKTTIKGASARNGQTNSCGCLRQQALKKNNERLEKNMSRIRKGEEWWTSNAEVRKRRHTKSV